MLSDSGCFRFNLIQLFLVYVGLILEPFIKIYLGYIVAAKTLIQLLVCRLNIKEF